MLPNHPCAGFVSVPRVKVPHGRATELSFGGTSFTVTFSDQRLRIERDPQNFSLVSLKDQRVAYKIALLGSIVLGEEVTGEVGWNAFFSVDWEDHALAPDLVFRKPATRIVQRYARGQSIELGLDPVSAYEVTYADGVEALFERKDTGFAFRFSTGFHGAFWKEEDGSWVLRFKGDRLPWNDDGVQTQSKFLVSRSKFTDNLLLYLQEDARVALR